MRIQPSVGRIVYYRPGPGDHEPKPTDGQPLAAKIAHVVEPKEGDVYDLVNLTVSDMLGNTYARQNVPLLQSGQPAPQDTYAEWMPFQVGQAGKTEQVADGVKDRMRALEQQVSQVAESHEAKAAQLTTEVRDYLKSLEQRVVDFIEAHKPAPQPAPNPAGAAPQLSDAAQKEPAGPGQAAPEPQPAPPAA